MHGGEAEEERIVDLKQMMLQEIENTRDLEELLKSGVHFMAMTDQGETELIYGENLPELLNKRIELMKKQMDDEPYIDHEYMMRRAGVIR